ncbi:Tetratricopeptide repeat protein 28 [Stylophora pistillata]|uniref:Tetratricopeptide repeat protein 28 n=1 Tax=Stylophora pistillata TaxID=50429 RepID=A0A2B4SEF3_STYPI|nr:Tetratricopeptide repeat protein 28 [Stylophora pistillata]
MNKNISGQQESVKKSSSARILDEEVSVTNRSAESYHEPLEASHGARIMLNERVEFGARFLRIFSSAASVSASAFAIAGTLARSTALVGTRVAHVAASTVSAGLLPLDITLLVKSSLELQRGSTSKAVEDIRQILSELECPEEEEIQLMVESFIDEKFTEAYNDDKSKAENATEKPKDTIDIALRRIHHKHYGRREAVEDIRELLSEFFFPKEEDIQEMMGEKKSLKMFEFKESLLEDFKLTVEDVSNIHLRAKLVVLSCCYSGRGEIKAEGVVGIARAYMGASARSVLVSMRAIDDETTFCFMKYFYHHLAEGKRASECLNLAMKSLRESENYSDVKYWAPFALIGDDVSFDFNTKE